VERRKLPAGAARQHESCGFGNGALMWRGAAGPYQIVSPFKRRAPLKPTTLQEIFPIRRQLD